MEKIITFKAKITSKGFEETIQEETVVNIHKKLLIILQQLNIDFMPHQIVKLRALQKYYKALPKNDYKYLVAGKSIIQISK